eukprot:5603256-Prymnesium_polylepis.1
MVLTYWSMVLTYGLMVLTYRLGTACGRVVAVGTSSVVGAQGNLGWSRVYLNPSRHVVGGMGETRPDFWAPGVW